MTLNSYAKINLALYVKDKRNDGFHDIETIFTQISLKDTIHIIDSPDLIVETDDPTIPDGAENIVYKAVEYLKKEFNIDKNVSIQINKKIPAGGGLAGGSSNASTVIKALIEKWNIKPDKSKTDRILCKLGSDVPYSFYGGTMLGVGRGEKLTPLPPFKGYTILIIFPDISVSTAWAYKNIKKELTLSQDKITLYNRYIRFINGELNLDKLLYNDFEKAVFEKFPKIKILKESLASLSPDGLLMSGSGSTLLGFFRTEKDAEKANLFFSKKNIRTCIAGAL